MGARRLAAAWILAVLMLLTASARAEEILLPDFDHGEIKASFVLSVPPGYDAAKKWPLILDFHGAISPTQKGARVTTARLWSKFVEEHDYIVAAPNSRTRSWGTVKGEKNDLAYAHRVLTEVKKKYAIDEERIFLAGFSSGSDFLCRGGLAEDEAFAGALVVCPGPPSVVGLRGGELLRAKRIPFVFVAGEEDYVRKSGAFQAFAALDAAEGKTTYREVPGVPHAFPGIEEYALALAKLAAFAAPEPDADELEIAKRALARDDRLLASTHLLRLTTEEAKGLLGAIEKRGRAEAERAATLDVVKSPGEVYEAWWRIRTQYHRFPKLVTLAEAGIAKLKEKIPNRDLYRARKEWFRRRARPPAPERTEREAPDGARGPGVFSFDRYLTWAEIEQGFRELAEKFPQRARLSSMGKSVEGRDIPVLAITDYSRGTDEDKPAVYLQAGIHGNEISSPMVALYVAWQLAANPEKSRGTDRLLRDKTVYIVPAVNPDAVHHFMTGAHSFWRPRFNYRPHDRDGDGKIDEDPYDDLDGDGEISLMYAPDPKGKYVLRDGKMVIGKGEESYRLVGREGIDDDDDGKFNEDRPGGVDLNRNFPVGFVSKKAYEGTTGTAPASEPETKAVIAFVATHPNIVLFLDYHNDGDCVFLWLGDEEGDDVTLLTGIAERMKKSLGYPVKVLRHSGAGLAAAWAYGDLGIPAFIMELEAARGDRKEYLAKAWGEAGWIPARPFDHPQLGKIMLGNDYTKLAKRAPHPRDIFWQVDRQFAWLKEELARLPVLTVMHPLILFEAPNTLRITGVCENDGEYPAETRRGIRRGRDLPVSVGWKGGGPGVRIFPPPVLDGAGSGAFELAVPIEGSVTLRIHHPRAGTVEFPVVRPRAPAIPIRGKYEIEAGYATPDRAVPANNDFYVDGVTGQERGPAFETRTDMKELRIAVLLGEWEDQGHVVPAVEFQRAFFSRGGYLGRSFTGQEVYGSVADFYAEMSYGNQKVTGKVFDWVTLPGKWKEYRDASFGSSMLHDRITAAVLSKHGPDALAGFDGLAFVWAGNAVKRTSMLWPMRLNLKDRPGVIGFKMSEIYRGEFAAIGVACHELGHTFGVNDKYGLGAAKNPLGLWCLIGMGTHGAEPSGRHRPFPFCAWCRSVIGWVVPRVIDPKTPQKLALRPTLFGRGECYRVLLEPDGSEYLLLENRRQEGFLTDLPSAGLAILKVGPNDKPGAPQKMVELLPAHGLPPTGRSDPAKPEAIAWPQPGKTEVEVGNVRISNIRLVDDVIYFQVGPAGG